MKIKREKEPRDAQSGAYRRGQVRKTGVAHTVGSGKEILLIF